MAQEIRQMCVNRSQDQWKRQRRVQPNIQPKVILLQENLQSNTFFTNETIRLYRLVRSRDEISDDQGNKRYYECTDH